METCFWIFFFYSLGTSVDPLLMTLNSRIFNSNFFSEKRSEIVSTKIINKNQVTIHKNVDENCSQNRTTLSVTGRRTTTTAAVWTPEVLLGTWNISRKLLLLSKFTNISQIEFLKSLESRGVSSDTLRLKQYTPSTVKRNYWSKQYPITDNDLSMTFPFLLIGVPTISQGTPVFTYFTGTF